MVSEYLILYMLSLYAANHLDIWQIYVCICLQRLSKSSNKLVSKSSTRVYTADSIESRYVICYCNSRL